MGRVSFRSHSHLWMSKVFFLIQGLALYFPKNGTLQSSRFIIQHFVMPPWHLLWFSFVMIWIQGWKFRFVIFLQLEPLGKMEMLNEQVLFSEPFQRNLIYKICQLRKIESIHGQLIMILREHVPIPTNIEQPRQKRWNSKVKLGLEPKSTMLGGWDWVASGSPFDPPLSVKNIGGFLVDLLTLSPMTDGRWISRWIAPQMVETSASRRRMKTAPMAGFSWVKNTIFP